MKYCNDTQRGRPLLWLMVMDAELTMVDGKPVIQIKMPAPVPGDEGTVKA